MRAGWLVLGVLLGLGTPAFAAPSSPFGGDEQTQTYAQGASPIVASALDRMCQRISYRINTLVDHSNTGCRIGIDGGGLYSVVIFSQQAIVPDHKLRERWLDMTVDSVGLFTRAEGLQSFTTLNILDRFDIDDGIAYQMPIQTAAALEDGYTEGTLDYKQFHDGILDGLVIVNTINGR